VSADRDPRLAEIQALLRQGQKITAIKVYREVFAVSLAEARHAVELLDGGTPLRMPEPEPTPPVIPAPQLSEVRALAEGGRKIDAIRIYRELTGASLVDAKSAVEAMVPDSPAAPAPAPRQVPVHVEPEAPGEAPTSGPSWLLWGFVAFVLMCVGTLIGLQFPL
jgi:ribosomal protein L7/L12